MTIDEHLTGLNMTTTEFARSLKLAVAHAWKLRERRIQPSLQLAGRIVDWSEGAVTIKDMLRPMEDVEAA